MDLTLEQIRTLLGQAEDDLREAKEALREREALVRFFHRHLESIEASTQILPGITAPTGGHSYTGMKLPAAIKAVLQEHGRAMHVSEIADRLVRGGLARGKHLQTSITTAAKRRHDLFVKVRRATFALRNGVTEDA